MFFWHRFLTFLEKEPRVYHALLPSNNCAGEPSAPVQGRWAILDAHAENRTLILRTDADIALTDAEDTGYNLRRNAENVYP
jgi:hypothetical protein